MNHWNSRRTIFECESWKFPDVFRACAHPHSRKLPPSSFEINAENNFLRTRFLSNSEPLEFTENYFLMRILGISRYFPCLCAPTFKKTDRRFNFGGDHCVLFAMGCVTPPKIPIVLCRQITTIRERCERKS